MAYRLNLIFIFIVSHRAPKRELQRWKETRHTSIRYWFPEAATVCSVGFYGVNCQLKSSEEKQLHPLVIHEQKWHCCVYMRSQEV